MVVNGDAACRALGRGLPCRKCSVNVVCAQSCLTPCGPLHCSPPDSSVQGIFQKEYWGGLPNPSPGDLHDTGIELTSLTSSASTGGFFAASATVIIAAVITIK